MPSLLASSGQKAIGWELSACVRRDPPSLICQFLLKSQAGGIQQMLFCVLKRGRCTPKLCNAPPAHCSEGRGSTNISVAGKAYRGCQEEGFMLWKSGNTFSLLSWHNQNIMPFSNQGIELCCFPKHNKLSDGQGTSLCFECLTLVPWPFSHGQPYVSKQQSDVLAQHPWGDFHHSK